MSATGANHPPQQSPEPNDATTWELLNGKHTIPIAPPPPPAGCAEGDYTKWTKVYTITFSAESGVPDYMGEVDNNGIALVTEATTFELFSIDTSGTPTDVGIKCINRTVYGDTAFRTSVCHQYVVVSTSLEGGDWYVLKNNVVQDGPHAGSSVGDIFMSPSGGWILFINPTAHTVELWQGS